MKRLKILVLVFICLLSTLSFFGCNEQDKIITYNNVELYKDDSYCDLSLSYYYDCTVEECKLYLPNYNDFKYKEYVKNFYIFDGLATFRWSNLSFILELQFEDIATYNEFLEYENGRFTYSDRYSIRKNDYVCKITTDESVTIYRYNHDDPFMFGLLCENQLELKIRYFYFRECERAVLYDYNNVFRFTDCEW